jgi:hypothetical protein
MLEEIWNNKYQTNGKEWQELSSETSRENWNRIERKKSIIH